MRRVGVLAFVLVAFAGRARAACPPDCFAGGGPAATDCFVQFGGVAGKVTTCHDGDPACDADGAPDLVCTFPLTACVGGASTGCTATPLTGPPVVKGKSASAQALGAALAGLGGGAAACTPATPGFAVPIKVVGRSFKPGKATVSVTAAAGGKKDRDKLKLVCALPVVGGNGAAVPSLANDVQPIFDAKCATPGCHVGTSGGGNLNLERGNVMQAVGRPAVSTLAKGLPEVRPGDVLQSYMARKILGVGLQKFDSPMPQGCPGVTPCLTAEERAIVLRWIQGGAPDD